MDRITITGGKELIGSVRIQGSKNAALPMMAAALLHDGETVISACPKILDVFRMVELLELFGVKVTWINDDLHLDARSASFRCIPQSYESTMRASIILMGSMLGRFRKSRLPFPGGCVIGRRPIDIHLDLFKKMGAYLYEEDGMLCADAADLHGCEYTFTKQSVGATQNALLAAVLADGGTVLHNAACEPEVGTLISMLNHMGAAIECEQQSIRVTPVKALHDTACQTPPDRIVAGTYLLAAAATRGVVLLDHAPVDQMEAVLAVYKEIGGQYKAFSGKILADARAVDCGIPYLETAPYPGFPTDLQSPLMAVLATIPQKSQIHESVFDNRFRIATDLSRMGAVITTDGRNALIEGSRLLRGCLVNAQELRGGAALVLAGLAATGSTTIENSFYIERGYLDICADMRALGAVIDKE